jgi:dTDP-4-amino-4,6-dideoxygalactose transaminase
MPGILQGLSGHFKESKLNIPFVDLHAQYLSIKPEIDRAIATVIAESAFVRGGFVDTFESQFASAVGVKHCVSCANGTDALYILMKGLKINPGDEVITTAHSWISTSETITQAGGKIVFCDTDADTFTIDPKHIEAKVTSRTVGIIPVHLYGQPADMDPIMEIARRRNLWVIEDCAQAHMAQYKGRTVGTMGTAASFSFYPGKNLGAMGDAGCIVTNDSNLAGWCELYARHGGKGEHTIEGINSRLDGLQAAILSAKLPHLASWTATRQSIAKKYDGLLRDAAQVRTPKITTDRTHVFHLYVIRCEERDALQAHLTMAGISTMLNYSRGLPFYPAYAHLGHKPEEFPNVFANQSRVLSIPIYPEMTDEAIEFVAASIARSAR